MNVDLTWPITETEDLLLSNPRNCETPFGQRYTKPKETLELKPNEPRKNFPFKTSFDLSLDSKGMIGLPNLEVHSSFFITMEENDEFDFYTVFFDEFSFTELKDEDAELIPYVSSFTNKGLKGTREPHNIQLYKKLASEKRQTEDCFIL